MGTIYFSSSLSLVARICHISGLSPFRQQQQEGENNRFFFEVREKMMSTYQRSHTATRAIFVDNPKLGMYLKGVKNDINIFGVAVLELLQDLDLV